MNEFILDLTTIRPDLERLAVEAPARDIGLDEAEWPGSVRGSFRVDKTGETVSVRGNVFSVARLDCARCLQAFDLEIAAETSLLAERSGQAARDEQRQLERDAYMLFHDGRRLDLRESVRESLLLELPISPHCREDCRGLCPRCGANRNEGACACETADSRGSDGGPSIR